MENNYLSHHGVKGQKWGERKYQYEDGSLTAEGRRHYGYGDGNRQRLRAEIKIVREKARAERKMARVENAERIKYEKQKQKLDAKIQKAKAADKIKAERLKEKQALKDTKEQKRQIAEFKRKHPLQYNRIKKYLNEDGVLTDEGKMLFFGNGQKKNIKNMSNQDLRNAAYRMQLKNQYNEQVSNYNRHDPKAQALSRAGKVAGAGVTAFIGTMLTQSVGDLMSGGKDEVKANLKENGKKAALAAISASGITLTSLMGLASKKGNKAYNAFELRNDFNKKNDQNSKEETKTKSKAKEQYDQFKEEMGKRSRVHKKAASSTTTKTSTTTPFGKARERYGSVKTTPRLTSNSSAFYRSNTNAINQILSNRGDSVFNSNRIQQRILNDTYSQAVMNSTVNRQIGDRIINSVSDIPYSEIAGYLPERHS